MKCLFCDKKVRWDSGITHTLADGRKVTWNRQYHLSCLKLMRDAGWPALTPQQIRTRSSPAQANTGLDR